MAPALSQVEDFNLPVIDRELQTTILSFAKNLSYINLIELRRSLKSLKKIALTSSSIDVRDVAVFHIKKFFCTSNLYEKPVPDAIREVRTEIMNCLITIAPRALTSYFQGGELDSLDLYGVDFSSTNLTDVSFRYAFLVGANFKNALLEGASFSGCDLRNTDFTDAILTNAIFNGSDWFNASGLTEKQLKSAKQETFLQCPKNKIALHNYLRKKYIFPFKSWEKHLQDQLINAWDGYLEEGGVCDVVSSWKMSQRQFLPSPLMPAPNADQQTILFLAANPKDTGRLRVDQELRDIDEGLKRAQKRDQFKLEQRLAVRPRDIQRAMLDVNPQIIHFSGHGKGEAGLIFEDDIGNTKLVDGAALAGLFELFADQIHCVVLNGCYSEAQAKAIVQHIPFVIGMNQGIGDRATIAFAVGFYDALGAGRSIEFAYKLGCSAIRLEGITEHLTPVLLKQSPEGAAMIQQTTNAPIEVFISFSHKDDDLREELVTHLSNLRRQGKISAWHDRAIEAGEEWEAQIKGKLESAQIILLLVSSSFMASDYCYDIEMERAIERHDAGSARVIPILLRPCDWKGSPFSKLKILPKDGKAVTDWRNQDTAFVDVVQGIRQAVDSLAKNGETVQPTQVTLEAPEPSIQVEKPSLLQLTADQRKGLRAALISAFPGQPELELMVEDELGESLNQITHGQPNYVLAVRDLVKWAEAGGKLRDLLEGALRSNSGNPKLQKLARLWLKIE